MTRREVFLDRAVKDLAKLIRTYRRIPDGTSGKIEVKTKMIPAGAKETVISLRQSIFSGVPSLAVTLESPYPLQELYESDQGLWMTNRPCELLQMWEEFAKRAKGNVLVGGLGLGCLLNMLQRKRVVESITVVEASRDVICLVAPSFSGSKTLIVCEDLYQYVKGIKAGDFDTAFLDIWQGTGEWVWQTEVVPLRRTIGNKIPIIKAWQEDVMVGQVLQGLVRSLVIPPEKIRSRPHCHWYAFGRGIRELGIKFVGEGSLFDLNDPKAHMLAFQAEVENAKNVSLRAIADLFVGEVGSLSWEERFGKYWDEAFVIKGG